MLQNLWGRWKVETACSLWWLDPRRDVGPIDGNDGDEEFLFVCPDCCSVPVQTVSIFILTLLMLIQANHYVKDTIIPCSDSYFFVILWFNTSKIETCSINFVLPVFCMRSIEHIKVMNQYNG